MRGHGSVLILLLAVDCGRIGYDVARAGDGGAPGSARDVGTDAGPKDAAPAPGAWWNRAWRFRKRVRIEPGASQQDLAGFPWLIRLDSAPELAQNARADAQDLLFTAADGITPIPHEIERYESTTGALTAWVRLPVLAAAGTELFFYFGNTNATDRQDPLALWQGLYDAVLHFGGATVARNVASPRYVAAAQGTATTPPGQIVSALQFAGQNSVGRVSFAAGDELLDGWTQFTISLWVDNAYDSDRTWESSTVHIAGKEGVVNLLRCERPPAFAADSGLCQADIVLAASGTKFMNVMVARNRWHHIAWRYDGSRVAIFRDGALTNTAAAAGDRLASSRSPLELGSYLGAAAFQGLLDEFRLTRRALSDAWVAAEHANQLDPKRHVVVSAAEKAP